MPVALIKKHLYINHPSKIFSTNVSKNRFTCKILAPTPTLKANINHSVLIFLYTLIIWRILSVYAHKRSTWCSSVKFLKLSGAMNGMYTVCNLIAFKNLSKLRNVLDPCIMFQTGISSAPRPTCTAFTSFPLPLLDDPPDR